MSVIWLTIKLYVGYCISSSALGFVAFVFLFQDVSDE